MTLEYIVKEAKEEGEASGRAAEKIEMAEAMKSKNYPIDEIAELTGLPKEKLELL